jgi:type I restriction enzyme S subunit
VSQYRSYPQHRASGLDWLGAVPSAWELQRLRYTCALGTDKLDELPIEATYLGLENIAQGNGKLAEADPVGETDGSVARFEKGDVLFGKLRPYLAKCWLSDRSGFCSTEFFVLKPRFVNGSYLNYLLLSDGFVRIVDSSTYGTKMPRANWEFVGGLRVPLPSQSEQRAIGVFLDRETARIDSLVASKERLVELLREKRTALVTRAVTKGLDPNVPIRDSGLAWLREIPAHWEVRRVKSLSTFVTSGSRGWAGYYSDEGSVFLRIGNLSSRAINLDLADVQCVSPPTGSEGERTRVHPGDVIVSITALIGAVGIVPSDFPEAYVNQHLALIRPDAHRVHSRWSRTAFCLQLVRASLLHSSMAGPRMALDWTTSVTSTSYCPPSRSQ